MMATSLLASRRSRQAGRSKGSAEQAKTFDSTKINDFVQNYSDPPTNCVVYKSRHEEKNYVLLEVPQFPDTQHIRQKDYSGTLAIVCSMSLPATTRARRCEPRQTFAYSSAEWCRTKATNCYDPCGPSKGVPSGVPQPSEQFGEQIVASRREFAQRNPLQNKNYDYFLETVFIPESFVSRRFEVEKLRETAFEASVDFIGWPFLQIHLNRPDVLNVFEHGLESFWYADDFFGGRLLDFWRLYQCGLFYKKELPLGVFQ